MARKFLFSNPNMSYGSYLETVKENSKDGSIIFASKECVELGLLSLAKLDDEEKIKRIMDFSLFVDREYNSSPGDNASHKLAYIFSGVNMICNYSSYVEGLNNNELSLLTFFSYVVDDCYMKDHLMLFASPDLLDSVLEKTPKRSEQASILGIVEDKYFEFDIDTHNESEFNRFKQASIDFVRNNSTEELLSQVQTYNDRIDKLASEGIYF